MTEIPTTIKQLEEWISGRFHCMEGPAMAYFEFPIFNHSPHENNKALWIRIVYKRIAFSAKGVRPEAELVKRLFDFLQEKIKQCSHYAVDEHPILFWRQHLHFEVTKESVDEDRDLLPPAASCIYCRVAIPGITDVPNTDESDDVPHVESLEVQS